MKEGAAKLTKGGRKSVRRGNTQFEQIKARRQRRRTGKKKEEGKETALPGTQRKTSVILPWQKVKKPGRSGERKRRRT